MLTLKQWPKNAGLLIVIYNNPLYTGNNMSPGLIARTSNIPGIIGLKQTNPDLGQLVEVLRTSREGFSILTGIDSLIRRYASAQWASSLRRPVWLRE